MRTGLGTAGGSCGELLQGVLPDGRDFLVTLPIRQGSTAVFEPGPDSGVVTVPAHKTKARRLAEAMLARSPEVGGGRLTLHSELPEGKGLASSSADLVATARAIADAGARSITAAEIEDELRAIEPSDGVMYPGPVAFCHREVRLLARLAPPPPLTIVLGDEGGAIDTVEFNRRPKPFTAADRREYARLLDRLRGALADRDPVAIGAVSTRSAVLNDRLRPRPHLPALRAAATDIEALGVIIAHSGTTAGILLADDDPEHRAKRAAAHAAVCRFAHSVSVHRTRRPAEVEPATELPGVPA